MRGLLASVMEPQNLDQRNGHHDQEGHEKHHIEDQHDGASLRAHLTSVGDHSSARCKGPIVGQARGLIARKRGAPEIGV
jgi:hypothetical protein